MKSTLFLKLFLFSLLCCFAHGKGFFEPLSMPEYNVQKAKLGEKIFRDTKFNQKRLSCESCHNLYLNETGASAQDGQIPTILNAYYIERYLGDRHFMSLEERIEVSVLSKNELNSHKGDINKIINENLAYEREFKLLYGKASFENFVDALGHYLKSKTTLNSKFDRALRDELNLDENESKGYTLFIELCSMCHNGVNLGTNNFARVGVKPTDFLQMQALRNRENFTGKRYVYKRVPTLRNITKTAPYVTREHSLKRTLTRLLEDMLEYELSDEDIESLMSFLATLEGESTNKDK